MGAAELGTVWQAESRQDFIASDTNTVKVALLTAVGDTHIELRQPRPGGKGSLQDPHLAQAISGLPEGLTLEGSEGWGRGSGLSWAGGVCQTERAARAKARGWEGP